MIDPRFSLLDHNDNPVSEHDFRGRWMLVYFGFTNCQVVCPRSLGKLTQVLDDLGEVAQKIASLYITVDPARDTPAVMKQWLEANYPQFTGLTGSAEQVDDAKTAFRVFAQPKADVNASEGYVVPHTAIAYLIDPQGQYCAHFIDSIPRETIAARMLAIISKEEVQSNA